MKDLYNSETDSFKIQAKLLTLSFKDLSDDEEDEGEDEDEEND